MPLKFTKALAIIGLTVLAVFLVINQLGNKPTTVIDTSSAPKHAEANPPVEAANGETQQHKTSSKPVVTTDVETIDVETIDVETTDVETTDVKTTDVKTTDVETTDVETTDVETTDVETTDVETTDVETTDVETTDVETTDVEITDVETTEVETTDIETATVETSGLQTSEETVSDQQSKNSGLEEVSKAENILEDIAAKTEKVEAFCKEFSGKLRTVKYDGCMQLGLDIENKFQSVAGRSLTFRYFNSNNTVNVEDQGRILFISGIHGDEYSAISITYLWMLNMLKHEKENQQNWLFLPLSNPDGLFRSPATRINANKVDLNRNFPSPDWEELALDYWTKYYKKNRRRYPGPTANSEPETQWMVKLIEEFKPDAIISVHAPYGLVDYDGPDHAVPNRIGALKHRELGTYPGSLGRYAGEYLKIPVLTLELRAAGSMPSEQEIYTMWKDVEEWTKTKIKGEDLEPIPGLNKIAHSQTTINVTE